MEDSGIKNWYGMSDAALLEQVGEFIKDARLKANKTQQEVAAAAGVSRSTVAMLEKGNGGTLTSLLQVLRVLGLLHVLQPFEVDNSPSPLQLAKLQLKKRQRAVKAKK